MIVPGSTSQALAAELATELSEPLASVSFDRFPDGEVLAAAPGFDSDRAVIVAATTSADAHLELLQLQDAVREAGAEEIITVLPYMGYHRQEKPMAPGKSEAESPPGYPISARAVARAISTGTDRILVVNPHEELVCDFFDVPAEPVDAATRLAEPLPEDLTDPVFLSPDEGAIGLAETVRDAYGRGSTDYFEKVRHSGDEVEITPSDVDVANRDVVVTDDIIATGSTMSQSVGVLRDRGVDRVYVTAVHGMLVRDALAKLRRAGVEAVMVTDTVERAVSTVSVAPVVAEQL